MKLDQQVRLLTMMQAAEYRGIPYETFRYHVKEGQGPAFSAYLNDGRDDRPLYTHRQVDEWVRRDGRKDKKK